MEARLIRLVCILHRISDGECVGVSGRSPDLDRKEYFAKGREADLAKCSGVEAKLVLWPHPASCPQNQYLDRRLNNERSRQSFGNFSDNALEVFR